MLDTNIVKEGGIIKVRVGSDIKLIAGEVLFRGEKYPVFYNKFDKRDMQGNYISIIPVPLGVKGNEKLTIRCLRKDGVKEQVENIKIKKLKSEVSEINTGQTGNRGFLKALARENRMIKAFQKDITPVKFRFPFIRPVDGRISGSFGKTRIYDGDYEWRHKGIDIAAIKGTPVRATNNGTVKTASSTKAHGNVIIIDHGAGVYSLYYHLSKIYVKKERIVSKGDVIGAVGSTGLSTGPHLHWQINAFKIPVNPIDLLVEF